VQGAPIPKKTGQKRKKKKPEQDPGPIAKQAGKREKKGFHQSKNRPVESQQTTRPNEKEEEKDRPNINTFAKDEKNQVP